MFIKITKNLNIHQSLSDAPNTDDGLSAAQLKAKFDEPADEIKTKFNNLINDLEDESASDNIGCKQIHDSDTSGTTLTNKLQYIYGQIEETVAGSIPDNSITSTKIESTFRNSLALKSEVTALDTKVTTGTYKRVLYYRVPSLTNEVEKTVQLSTGHVYRLIVCNKYKLSGISSDDYATLTWNGTSIKPSSSNRADCDFSCDIYVNDTTLLDVASNVNGNVYRTTKILDNSENVTIRWTAGNATSSRVGIEAGSVMIIYEL